MRKKLNKILSIFLIVFLMVNIISPSLVLAQEVTPTDTPTPTQTTVDNTSTASNGTNNTANTGDNSVNVTPTPTPDATVTPDPTLPTDTPTPTPSITDSGTTTSQSSAQVDNSNANNANTGNNTVSATDSATLDATSSADLTATDSADLNATPSGSLDGTSGGPSINTGDAVSQTSVENDINSTSVNSKVVTQTINLFIDQNGNINLSDPYTIATAAVQAHPNDPVVNVAVTNVNNFAYLANNVVSIANTGNNAINAGDAIINTGNAYSIVSLLNNVNFTVVGSDIHVITINIFGNLNGNIVLPNLASNTSTNCGCGVNIGVNNNAVVDNNASSTANSGTNTINGSGTISTGDATSALSNLNIINTNVIGSSAEVLFINNLGTWNGNFIGWDNFAAQNGGGNLVLYGLNPNTGTGSGCNCTGDVNINNFAYVYNNVSSLANTGGNNINGKGGSITTGSAYSAVSLINFINSNFINSFGFFGFINIFGNWNGNIGGANEFAALDSQNQNNAANNQSQTNSNSNDTKEAGGQLSVTNSNNVGEFVFPGDTVTFFIKVKNTGTGKVYGAKVDLYLVRNGINTGGSTFDLGDIEAGHSKTLTTGFVLSKNAPGGTYTAESDAYGTVGPNNDTVSATAQSTFKVLGTAILTGSTQNIVTGANKKVLGSSFPLEKGSAQNQTPLNALILILISYILIRAFRQRKNLKEIFQRNISFKEKVLALRMFLL